MKRIFYPVILIFLMMFWMAGPSAVFGHSSGSPSGRTGSPGDVLTCTNSCHGGTASTVTGFITTNIPGSGYVAGNTYNITVSFTGSGGKGFEVSPQNVAGAQLGTLVAGSGSKLVGGTKYCTHSSKINGSTATWTFSWIAPAAGTGSVNFYGAFAITESTTKKEFITVTEDAGQPLGVAVTATPSSVCSGSSTLLNAIPVGGTGTYTFAWTSDPPGFNSSQQSPTATPAVTTRYFADVSDGVNSVNDSVLVTVQAAPSVFAGNDTTVCLQDTQIPLNGTTSNSSSILWSTSGDGTFSNPSTAQPIYYPGTADKAALSVNLTLTANGMGPCTIPVNSIKHISFMICDRVPSIDGKDLSFSVWPNPSAGRLTLSVKGTSLSPVSVQISDLTGNSRFHELLDYRDLSISHTLNLENLPSGIYVLKIECGTSARVQKLVIL
ncbi:MAG: T9SS type A sorting domain-containing protein [Bacteroidetes bacterium]|nr:T9SS type A sorting domain-containing protein [Bacteroidota bacterium]